MTEPVNFRVVDTENKIFRGGQPSNLSEWEYVYALGVRQVVKLNLESEAQDNPWLCLAGDTSLVYSPIDAWQQIVTEPEIDRVLASLDSITVPTYIHCEHGVNRTGLLCALYRVARSGWLPEQAKAEWHNYGAIALEQEGLEKAFEDCMNLPQFNPL